MIIRTLVIEADREDLITLRELMSAADAAHFHLEPVATLEDATARLEDRQEMSPDTPYDVALLSLDGPNGLADLERLRTLAPTLPVVVTCRPGREDTALMALEAGAQDYLIKAPGNALTVNRIHRAMERSRSEVRSDDASTLDPITGLNGRPQFRNLLRQRLSSAQDTPTGGRFALLALALDRFKSINDSIGHPRGDELLAAVAERLRTAAGEPGDCARIGGDTFAVAVPLPDLTDADNAAGVEATARHITTALDVPFHVDGHELYLTASTGVVVPAESETDPDSVLRNAERAMYRAKQVGPGSTRVYSPDMAPAAFERLRLEAGLRQALERDELVLYYQPQISLATGQITGIEALLRWHHPRLGLLLPAQFIWLAEETGLIVPIGAWALRTACEQAREWREKDLGPLRMVVNISPQQFRQEDLVEMIADTLTDTGMQPDQLAIEITEGILVENSRANRNILAEIKGLGVKLSIDDFGVEYSSLSYLKRIPADILKLDRTFVQDVATDPGDAAIARAVIALARGLSMTLIAEGVEEVAQYAFLKAEGCDAIQGFLIARPLPARGVEELVREGVEVPV